MTACICTATLSLYGYQLGAHGAWQPAAWAAALLFILWYTTLQQRLTLDVRTWLTLAVLYGSSVLLLCTNGLAPGGFMSTFGFVVMTAIVRGRRAALAAFALSLATLALCALGFASGFLRVVDPSLLDPQDGWNWLRTAAFAAGMVACVGGSGVVLFQELTGTLGAQRELLTRLSREAEERKQALESLAQAQERLVHAHKLEAVGRLSGGIAHDFNNTLTVILSYAELLKSKVHADPALRELSTQIIQAAEQGSDLTKQLLTFSRRQIVKPRIVDVQEVLVAVERSLLRLVPKSVSLEHRARGDLFVNIDPTQLQQAVLNLGINARDAMPDGGVLRLEAEVQQVDDPGALSLVRGAYVVIRVRDTGTGIARATQERIFEPFFTTKAPGLGTGLGLSNVRAMAEAAGGAITVESELGQGSTFSLYLPLTSETRVSGVGPRAFARSKNASANVLVVDGEAQIRDVVCAMLREHGYAACTADSAKDALAQVRAEQVDVLCVDTMLPDMSAEMLVEEVRRTHPRLPIILCSAFGTDESVSRQLLRDRVLFLAKPFNCKDLLASIERVRDAGMGELDLCETPTG